MRGKKSKSNATLNSPPVIEPADGREKDEKKKKKVTIARVLRLPLTRIGNEYNIPPPMDRSPSQQDKY
jgi:hypothetical protein